MCTWVCGIVHDEKEFSTDWGHWFQEGSYPGVDNGIRMLLDAENFDSGPGEATSEVPIIPNILWRVMSMILIVVKYKKYGSLH